MRRDFRSVLAAAAALTAPLVVATPASALPAAPSERVCFAVSGAPGDVAIVNLTPVNATAPGNGQLISSDTATPPEASNVNFAPGTVDPNVALAVIGADRQVCFVNSVHGNVDVIADDLGSLAAAAFTPTSTGAPLRRVDTRTGLGGGIIAPSERRCFTVGGGAGDAALVNLTPVGATRAGFGVLVPDTPGAAVPTSSNVNFGPGTVDPNVAVTTIGTGGQVCFVNSVHGPVHLIADELGTIPKAAAKPAAAGGLPLRVADTRRGIGGGMVVPSGRLCMTVAGAVGDVAFVNLTPVDATRAGFGQLVSSDVTTPAVASNVNFDRRTFDPNVAAARIGANRQVCFVNSVHAAVHLVADHLITVSGSAYTPPSANGAPVRVLDTRVDDAVVWSSTTVAPSALDCLTAEACVVAIGGNPVQSLTVNGANQAVTVGTAPTGTPAAPAGASTVECALLDKCFAVTTAPTTPRSTASLHVTTNRGSSWSAATLPRPVDVLTDISCASSARCLVVGSVDVGSDIRPVLIVTSNGGTSWGEVTVTEPVDQLVAVDCPSATLCIMVAKDGTTPAGTQPTRILRSTDAGATWTTVSVPTGSPEEVQCPTATTCVAITSSARHVSVDAGVSWTASPFTGPGLGVVDHVECPTAQLCLAAPGATATPRSGTVNVFVSTDLFATWTTRQITTGRPGTTARAVDVSCSSPTACYVTGTYDGAGNGGFITRVNLA